MNSLFKNIQFLLLILLSASNVFAQNDISLHTIVDSTIIGIDIPFQFKVSDNTELLGIAVLDGPAIQKRYADKYNFTKIDSSEHIDVDFEISDFGKWHGKDGIIRIDHKIKDNQILLKIWDPGAYMILPLIINKTQDAIDTIFPDRIDNYPSILVFPTSSLQDTIKDFTPIKDIIRETKTWEDFLVYIVAFLAVLFSILAIIFIPKLFRKRKEDYTEVKKKKVILPPAHIIALEKLEMLKKEEIWHEKSRIKEFQTRLTYTLREYLERRYKVKTLEQTTGEIKQTLTKVVEKKDGDLIQNILQISDLVKFAKATPSEDIHKDFLDKTIDFVNRTKEVKIEGDLKND